LRNRQPYDFDITLKIKGKEKNPLKALEIAKRDKRLYEKN